jgi:hypothetical protein
VALDVQRRLGIAAQFSRNQRAPYGGAVLCIEGRSEIERIQLASR